MYQAIIVDDEAKIRSGISQIFPWENAGFQIVREFSNGQEALDYVTSHKVDLIVSDIRMPVMDGIQLSEAVFRQKPSVKIIFLSGYQEFNYARDAIRYGVCDYLLKPVKYQELVSTLEKVKLALDKERGLKPSEEPSNYYDRIVHIVRQYIDDNYQNATLDKAGRIVGLSPNYLSRLLAERSAQSFSEYLLETRMKNAAAMLKDVKYKLYEIAYHVGYDNPKNFSRAFKQYYHITPKEYREKY